jgi:hypothetical protein
VGFKVFTLVVVLGTGDSVETTPPLCALRPVSGRGVACVVGGGAAPNCANALIANRNTLREESTASRPSKTENLTRFMALHSFLSVANELKRVFLTAETYCGSGELQPVVSIAKQESYTTSDRSRALLVRSAA